MRPALTLAALLAVSAPAFAQEPSVSYSVTVESPGGVAVGDVPVRVRVAGGVREAQFAAYHLRTAGGWSESQAVRLSKASEAVFQSNLDTAAIPNDAYRLEVRVWTDVPPYDPSDPRTYSRAILDFAVNNPPQTPQDLQALTPAAALRVGWDPVDDSDRSDFLGYRVFLSRRHPCPSEPAAYGRVAETRELTYSDQKLGPGDYCVRVAAARESAVSGEVLSAPSAPVKISIDKKPGAVVGGGGVVFGRGGGIKFERTDKVEPPPAPQLGRGDPVLSDGEFIQDLPYGPRTVTQAPGGGWGSSQAAVSREAGVDPKRAASLIAAGLILATMAGLIRRFLTAVPGV